MPKIFNSSHIIFMDSNVEAKFPCMGWNNAVHALSALNHRHGKAGFPVCISQLLDDLSTKGYLTPEQTLMDGYWIVEKCVPTDMLTRVWTQEATYKDVIEVLKV